MIRPERFRTTRSQEVHSSLMVSAGCCRRGCHSAPAGLAQLESGAFYASQAQAFRAGLPDVHPC